VQRGAAEEHPGGAQRQRGADRRARPGDGARAEPGVGQQETHRQAEDAERHHGEVGEHVRDLVDAAHHRRVGRVPPDDRLGGGGGLAGEQHPGGRGGGEPREGRQHAGRAAGGRARPLGPAHDGGDEDEQRGDGHDPHERAGEDAVVVGPVVGEDQRVGAAVHGRVGREAAGDEQEGRRGHAARTTQALGRAHRVVGPGRGVERCHRGFAALGGGRVAGGWRPTQWWEPRPAPGDRPAPAAGRHPSARHPPGGRGAGTVGRARQRAITGGVTGCVDRELTRVRRAPAAGRGALGMTHPALGTARCRCRDRGRPARSPAGRGGGAAPGAVVHAPRRAAPRGRAR
jgi:hypothetical protein